jgi:hypothetical protein
MRFIRSVEGKTKTDRTRNKEIRETTVKWLGRQTNKKRTAKKVSSTKGKCPGGRLTPGWVSKEVKM